MPSVIYKTLFEVKILHEYFLTRPDGSGLFDKTPQQKATFLQEEFSANHPAVNDLLAFEFPEAVKSQMEAGYLRIIPTYSGFKVVVKVMPRLQPGGELFYQPFTAIANNQDFIIRILRKGPIDSITGGRISRPFVSIYYFSNMDSTGTKNFPYLTNPTPAYDPGITYIQGDLSDNGGVLQEYQKKSGGNPIFYPVIGSGFAGEADRMLISSSILYRLPDRAGLTSADFILRDRDNNELDRLTVTGADNFTNGVKLNYKGKLPPSSLTSADLSTPLFTLEVRGNNGYLATHPLIINDTLASSNPWGIIHIQPTVSNAPFSSIASDGYLATRIDNMGVLTPAPVFEIPVKSRLVYYRYVHNRGEKLEVSPAMQQYLEEDGNALITLTPSRLARSFFKIRKENSASTLYAPNPVLYDLQTRPDGLIYYNIIVNHSKLFES